VKYNQELRGPILATLASVYHVKACIACQLVIILYIKNGCHANIKK